MCGGVDFKTSVPPFLFISLFAASFNTTYLHNFDLSCLEAKICLFVHKAQQHLIQA